MPFSSGREDSVISPDRSTRWPFAVGEPNERLRLDRLHDGLRRVHARFPTLATPKQSTSASR
jgi:hypothetical protein